VLIDLCKIPIESEGMEMALVWSMRRLKENLTKFSYEGVDRIKLGKDEGLWW